MTPHPSDFVCHLPLKVKAVVALDKEKALRSESLYFILFAFQNDLTFDMKEPTDRNSNGSRTSISPVIAPMEMIVETTCQIIYTSASRQGMPNRTNLVPMCNSLSTSKAMLKIPKTMGINSNAMRNIASKGSSVASFHEGNTECTKRVATILKIV